MLFVPPGIANMGLAAFHKRGARLKHQFFCAGYRIGACE